MSCEACERGAVAPWLEVRGYQLVRCERCGHGALAEPADVEALRRRYDHDYFHGDPDGYLNYHAGESGHRINARRHLDLLGRLAVAPGRLLDVGCAAGYLPDEARAAGWDVAGVEPSSEMAAFAREHTHVPILAATLDGLPEAARFDAITCVQVLEHIPLPARAIADALAQHLAPGGVVLIETWDAASRTARVFGRRWQQLSPPTVRCWFTAASLRETLEGAGLEVILSDRPGKLLTIDQAFELAQARFLPRVSRAAQRLCRRIGLAQRTLRYPLGDLIRIVARAPGERAAVAAAPLPDPPSENPHTVSGRPR